MIKSLQYNWSYILVAILLVVLGVMIFRGCDTKPSYTPDYVDSLIKSKDSAIAVANEYELRANKYAQERDSLEKRGERVRVEYRYKTRIERVVQIEKVIGEVVADSNGVHITYDQLDSINYIAIDRDLCESVLKKADKQIEELSKSLENYKIAAKKQDEAFKLVDTKLDVANGKLAKSIKKIKRNRKMAIGAGLIAMANGVVLYLKR